MKRIVQTVLCVFVLVVLLAAPCIAQGPVNVNNATVEQLTDLPGIGPAIAAKIVEYRTAHPFKSVEEVKEVKGIGQAKFDAIKGLITVGEAAPKKQ